MGERFSSLVCATSLALSIVAGVGCGTVGGKPYVRAYAAGDRAYSAGRFDEAAHAYEDASKIADRPRDREEALFSAAESFERAKEIDAALTLYDQLATPRPPGERTFYAAYRAAQIRLARGEKEKAYAALEAIFTEAPEEGIAKRALREVVLHVEETKGKAAAIAYEESIAPKFEGNRLGEELCYDLGVRKLDIGDANGALAGFLSCAQRWPYPIGALFDDSLFHASLLHEQLGDPKAAIADLERLLAVRESSSFNGTYDRPKMAPAQLRIGELQRDRTGDHAGARKSFHKLYTDFATSLLRPKALFEEAKLAHDDGDEASACALANLIIDEFGDSRWARRADDACKAAEPRAAALRKAREERRNEKNQKNGENGEADEGNGG